MLEDSLTLAADEATALMGEISIYRRRLKEGNEVTRDEIEALRYRAAQIIEILGSLNVE